MRQSWINLDAYGLRLVVVKTKNTPFLVITGKDASQYEKTAKDLGFFLHNTNKGVLHKMARLRADGSLEEPISPAKFIKAFPQAEIVDYDPSLHFVDQSEKVATPAEAAPKADGAQASGTAARLATSSAIGINRFGREVFDMEGKRWFRDDRGTVIQEGEAGASSPSAFLRATTPAELIECAEGLVEQAWRSKFLRGDDLDRFVEISLGTLDEAHRDKARAATAHAVSRWLARRNVKTMGEAFIASARLAEHLAFLADGRGADLASPASPIAISVQRALGTEVSLRGRKVHVHSPSPAAFATHSLKAAHITASYAKGADKEATQGIMAAAKLRADIGSQPDFSVDSIVVDLPAERKSGSGGPRNDFSVVARALADRGADGVGVFVLDAPDGEEENAQFEAWRSEIAAKYVFEGEIHIEGSMVRGRIGSPDKIVLSVGRRLDEPNVEALPPIPTRIGDWSALWTWTSEVVAHRAANRKVVTSVDEDVEFNAGTGNRNAFQTPYVSASAIGTPLTMVPRNLEGAMRDALAKVVRTHGDVDAFVAAEFGYTKEELADIFSPEQIDALALHVHAENRGRAFLNGDQTGVGKGRFLAACIRRRILKEGNAFFMTEREQNLSDIWRDIVATRTDHLLKPLILNADAVIIDPVSKEVLMRGTPATDLEKILKSGEVPAGYNIVLGTYSQINRDVKAPLPVRKDGNEGEVKEAKDVAIKGRWMRSAVTRKSLVLLDESHNAAGEGNIADNVNAMVQSAGSIVYSSATFAANSKRMSFYAPLLPDGITTNELASMMDKGGEVFQEVISGMLVADGVMVRREFDLSKLQFETVVDTARFERNRGLMDEVAPILAQLADLAGGVDRRIKRMNQEMDGNRRAAEADAPGRKKRYQITRTGFGSPLYTISRLFVAALKVDVVAEDAIRVLETGGKPIVLVENTMQQLFEEIADADDQDGVTVDLKALLNRILRNMVSVSHVNGKDEKIVRDVTDGDADLSIQASHLRRMIADMPEVSLSVIDDVKQRVENAGYTIGEITGRTLEIRNGRIMRRSMESPTVVKNKFNGGELDAIVINVAGATGIDLHASKTFKDKRQRFMLELQPPADVVKKMQARGRPNRYDQVIEPVIRTYLSGLPVEMRLAAMDNAKLRKLSANTTSNRDTAQLTRDVPDLINPIGDLVCSRYAESRPELMRRLGFNIGDVEKAADDNALIAQNAVVALRNEVLPTVRRKKADEAKEKKESLVVADSSRTANEILARLIMLPVDLQTKICDELIAEFNAAVEELEAKGETPLRAKEMSGIVHPRGNQIFDGAEVENPDSVFHEPLYLTEAALERTAEPMQASDLAERIELGELASGRSQPCIDRIKDGMDEILAPYLPEGVASVADAIARPIPDIVKRKEKLERFVEVLADIRPGKEISFTLDDGPVNAIVTRVDYPNRGYEHLTVRYAVEFACPGDEKPRTMRLDTLIKDPNFKIGLGLEGEDYADKLERFDNANKSKLSKVNLLTHNIFRAMQLNIEHNFGPLVTYRDAKGVVHRGVAVSKRFYSMKAIPVEIGTADMAYDAVMGKGIEINGASALDEKTFLIKPGANGIEIRLPPKTSRKYGHIYEDARLVDLANSGTNEGRKGIVVDLEPSKFKDIVQALYGVGARFWTIPAHREWSLEWQNQRHAETTTATLAIAR